MKEKILITGVAGLFGSNISRYFLSKNYQIIGLDNLYGGAYENIHPSVDFYNIDISNLKLLDNVISFIKPDYIIHFAAYAAEGLSHYIRNFNYQNNLIGTSNIVNCAINYNVKKVIFSSSMAVYGDQNKPPFNEEMTPIPIDPYGIAKYASELDFKTAKEHFGLDYSIIRPHNVIGIYQNLYDRYRNVIGIWIRQSLNKQPITIYGDGLQKRAFSDIFFYNEPIEKLLNEYSQEIFNLGSDISITILEAAKIVQACAKKLGYKIDIVFEEERKEAKYAFSDHSKAKKLLNFKDNTDIEKVIDSMFRWALESNPRPIKTLKYEINKNMYSYWKD